MKNKNIVIIGGGTGTSTLLQGLKKYPVHLSVVVSTADDGGSTGILRKKMGVMPPGDIRQCLAGLANNQTLAKFFSYRFTDGELQGHTVGNLLLAGMENHSHSVEQAIAVCAQLLDASGSVLPITLRPTTLVATFENGKKIVGEHRIDQPNSKAQSRIMNLELRPKVRPNPKVLAAIHTADAIVFSPGDLYTSLLPNLIVPGMPQAIAKSRAKKIMVGNIMTKQGQTDNFMLSNFIQALMAYLPGSRLDAVIANSQKPPRRLLSQYKNAGCQEVGVDKNVIKKMGITLVQGALISSVIYKKPNGDVLQRSILRHDSLKTAKIIWNIINQNTRGTT